MNYNHCEKIRFLTKQTYTLFPAYSASTRRCWIKKLKNNYINVQRSFLRVNANLTEQFEDSHHLVHSIQNRRKSVRGLKAAQNWSTAWTICYDKFTKIGLIATISDNICCFKLNDLTKIICTHDEKLVGMLLNEGTKDTRKSKDESTTYHLQTHVICMYIHWMPIFLRRHYVGTHIRYYFALPCQRLLCRIL